MSGCAAPPCPCTPAAAGSAGSSGKCSGQLVCSLPVSPQKQDGGMKRVPEGQGDAGPHRYPPVIPRGQKSCSLLPVLAHCSSGCCHCMGQVAGEERWPRGQSTWLEQSPSWPSPGTTPTTAQVFRCPDMSSHLDDGVADAPGFLAEHTVFEGLVHYNVGHFFQVHVTGVCREEEYCQD